MSKRSTNTRIYQLKTKSKRRNWKRLSRRSIWGWLVPGYTGPDCLNVLPDVALVWGCKSYQVILLFVIVIVIILCYFSPWDTSTYCNSPIFWEAGAVGDECFTRIRAWIIRTSYIAAHYYTKGFLDNKFVMNSNGCWSGEGNNRTYCARGTLSNTGIWNMCCVKALYDGGMCWW